MFRSSPSPPSVQPRPTALRAVALAPIALPASVNAFRLTGSGGSGNEPFWLADDMGGGFDPTDPQLGRRDFLLRAALAAVSLAVGAGVHAVSLTLARDSLNARTARAPESSEAETLSGGRP